MLRTLIASLLVCLGIASANAASYQGPLYAGDTLHEFVQNQTQATALANLGTVAHVPTTAALEALYPRYIGAGAVVVKDGWDAAGDMPPTEYTLVASPCPVNTYTGGGDGGAYFPAAYNPAVPGGECWTIGTQTIYDSTVWDVPNTGLDPKLTNGSQLTAMITYVGDLPSSAGSPQPMFNVTGPVLIDSSVTINGANVYGLNMNLLVGPGMGPSGGVCPAAVNLVHVGTHNFGNINVDVQFTPGVDVMHDSVNGTNHITIQGDHWYGICGSQTVTGSGTNGSNFIAVNSASGLADLMVSRGNSAVGGTGGVLDRSVIVDIPDSTTCTAQAGSYPCVVVSKALTASFTNQPLTFTTDASGMVCGFGGNNTGGTWPSVNLFEYLNNNYQVGVAAARYGYAFEALGGTSTNTSCNDIAILHGLIQEGVASLALGPYASVHLSSIEFNNGNDSTLAGAQATFSGAQMTTVGTVGTWAPGQTLTFSGETSPQPTILSQSSGVTGGDGVYILSASQSVTSLRNVQALNTAGAVQEPNTPNVLLAAGAANLDFGNRMQFNGGGIQSFVTRASGIGSNQTPINGESSKITSTNYVTQTPNAFLQLYTDQTATNMANINFDLWNSVLPSGMAAFTPYGPGTVAVLDNPNIFPLSDSTIEQLLWGQETYGPTTSPYTVPLSEADCGLSVAANTNTAATVFTLPDTMTSPASVGSGASCEIKIYTGGNYPDTLQAVNAATFNSVAGPVSLAMNTEYTIKSTGIPGSALNYSIVPAPLPGNAPATMTSSTGNTIGQLNIVKGTITRSNCGAALTDTTATATQIENVLPAGYDFINGGPPTPLRYMNTCAYPVTIAGGTGVTPIGNNVVPANSQADFVFTVTAIYPTPTMNMTASSVVHGQFIGVQTFSSTSCSGGCTYTPDVGTNEVIVEDIGAGGGAAGAVTTSTGQSAIGMGGGAGSYGKELFTTGFSGVTVTVPAGGAGGSAGAAGTAGSAATFGALLSCPGGMAGTATAAKSAAALGGVSGKAAACTFGTGTTLANIPGATSEGGIVLTAGSIAQSGMGANSPMGSGGSPVSGATANGNNASGFGAGGSGGSNASASEATATNGGNGAPAEELVYEYN